MISKGHRANFDTLLQAARYGDVCLLECVDDATGNKVMTICAVNHNDDGSVECVPIAKMFDGDPYKELRPPMIEEPVQ